MGQAYASSRHFRHAGVLMTNNDDNGHYNDTDYIRKLQADINVLNLFKYLIKPKLAGNADHMNSIYNFMGDVASEISNE